MTISLSTHPFGSPMIDALGEAIANAQRNDPFQRVTVVVRDHLSGVSSRRELAASGGICNVDFVTLGSVANSVGEPHLLKQGRLRLSSTVTTALAASVLAADPDFAHIADQYSAVEALVRVFEQRRINPDAVGKKLAAASSASQRWKRLADALDQAALPYYDLADLVAAAESVSLASDKEVLGSLILYAPSSLSEVEARLVRSLSSHVETSVIVGVDPRKGEDEAVASVRSALGLPKSGTQHQAQSKPDVGSGRPQQVCVSVTDSDAECRYVVRQLLAWRSDGDGGTGVSFDDMVVVYPTRSPYRAELERHLAAANVPYNAPSDATLGSSMAGRLLYKLLDIFESDYPRDDVMDLLAGAPIQMDADRLVPSARWDSISRRARVLGGAQGWRAALDGYVTEQLSRGKSEGELHGPRDLGSFMDRFIELTTPPDELSWASFGNWCHSMLIELLPTRRASWVEGEQSAYEGILLALNRVARLDSIVANPTKSQLQMVLDSELAAPLPRTGRLGSGVSIGPLTSLSDISSSCAVVVGCVEGTLPLVSHRSGPLDPPALSVADQSRAFASRLYSTRQNVVLTLPRGALLSRKEHAASRWVLDLLSDAGLERVPLHEWTSDLDGVVVEASHTAGVSTAAVDATENDRIARMILHERDSGSGNVTLGHLAQAIPDLGWGFEATEHRSSGHFGRFNGLIPGSVDVPSDQAVSASRVQDYAACPQRYFLKNVLGLRPEDTPEEVQEISALDRGSLVHQVLEAFFLEHIDAGTVPQPVVAWSDEQHHRMDVLFDEHAAVWEAGGYVGRPSVWETTKAQIRADLHRMLVRDNEMRRDLNSTPVAVEAPFGSFTDDRPRTTAFALHPVTLELDSGTLEFHGEIDRIDRCDPVDGSGTVSYAVMDYKTSRPVSEKNVISEIATGVKVQLPIYGSAIRSGFIHLDEPTAADTEVRSSYWYCSSKGGFKDVAIELSDQKAHFEAAMRSVVTAMRAGVYVANPGDEVTFPHLTFQNCQYCDFDALCRSSRGAEWDSSVDGDAVDPGVRAYVELTTTNTKETKA